MLSNYGYAASFIAGFFSFFSPCVLPLAPVWLCYMAGVSLEDFRHSRNAEDSSSLRLSLMLTAFAFISGFSIVFVALGVSASFLGQILRLWRGPLMIISGFLIMLMGLKFLGFLKIPFLLREVRFAFSGKASGFPGACLTGMAFAFAWTPCIGPVLSSILALAASGDTLFEGAFLLSFYSAGFALPFFFVSVFSSMFMYFLDYFHRFLWCIEKIIGFLLVFLGILFMMDRVEFFSYRLFNPF